MRDDQRLVQIGHQAHERLERPPIQAPVVRLGDVDAKVGVDLAGAVGVEDQLAPELQSGVDAIALLGEVIARYGDALIVSERHVVFMDPS